MPKKAGAAKNSNNNNDDKRGATAAGPGSGLSANNDSRTSQTRPQWPKLQPLVPASDLGLEVLLDKQIVLVHKLFTSTLCRHYTSFLSSLPLTTTPGKPKKGEALRVNDRYQIDDPDFASLLWSSTALQELVTSSADCDWGGEVVGLNPNIRVYRYVWAFYIESCSERGNHRYTKGQFFDQHCEFSKRASQLSQTH